MKLSAIFLLVSFFTILLSGCSKDKGPYIPLKPCSDLTRNKDTILLFIQGRWNWLEDKSISRDGTINYYTPSTEGYTEELKITGDTIIFYKDRQVASPFKFKIIPEKEISFRPEDNNYCLVLYDIITNSFKNYYPVKICSNYLILEQTYRSDFQPDRTFKRKL